MQNTETPITIDELVDELRSFHANTRNLIHKQRYTRDKLQEMSLEIANLKTALESEIEDTENLMTGIKMYIERLEKLY